MEANLKLTPRPLLSVSLLLEVIHGLNFNFNFNLALGRTNRSALVSSKFAGEKERQQEKEEDEGRKNDRRESVTSRDGDALFLPLVRMLSQKHKSRPMIPGRVCRKELGPLNQEATDRSAGSVGI